MPVFILISSSNTVVESVSSWISIHPSLTAILGIVLLILVLLIALLLKPVNLTFRGEITKPTSEFEDSIKQIESIFQEEIERGDLSQAGLTVLLHHGQKVENAVILIHGFTSAPQQFRELGEKFFEHGFNVFIPRQPHHGIADTSNRALKDYNAQVMVDFTNQVIDLAHGLGEKVTVIGLSGAGTMAAWAAQNRKDLFRSGSIAPMLGVGFIPARLTKILAKLSLRLPNFYMWWDPTLKAANPNTEDYQYPGYPIHALGEVMRLSFAVRSDAELKAPAAQNVIMVSNENDLSVNNQNIDQLVALWKSKGDHITHHIFSKDLGLAHDFITPTRDGFRADIVYPTLLDLFSK